jgi:hypothetical protein
MLKIVKTGWSFYKHYSALPLCRSLQRVSITKIFEGKCQSFYGAVKKILGE